jgi:hypothetical protein
MTVEAEVRYLISVLAIPMAGHAPRINSGEIREFFPLGMARTTLLMTQPGKSKIGKICQGESIMGIVAADAGGVLFIDSHAAMQSLFQFCSYIRMAARALIQFKKGVTILINGRWIGMVIPINNISMAIGTGELSVH